MKTSIRFTVLLLAFCALQATAAQASEYLEVDKAFIKEHLVSDEIAQKLDKHADKLAQLVKKIHATPRQKNGVWMFKWLPGYYVKYNVTRVTKGEHLARVIKEEGLDLLHVPNKKLYHIKGRPEEFNSLNYVVVVKKVKDTPKEYHKKMTLEQVKQIITAIKKSGHLSLYEPNHLRLSGGRISFIDTDGGFNKEKTTVGIVRLFDRNLSHYYTPEALLFIIDEIAYGLVNEPIKKRKNKWIDDLAGFLDRQKQPIRKKIKTILAERIAQYEKLGGKNEQASS